MTGNLVFWPGDIPAGDIEAGRPGEGRIITAGPADNAADLPGAVSADDPVWSDGGVAATAARTWQVEFLDADSNPLETVEVAQPEPVWTEFPGPDGTFDWIETDQPVTIPVPRQADLATQARIRWSGVDAYVEQAVRVAPPADDVSFWPDSADATCPMPILLIAEWFEDRTRFWDACAQFAAALRDCPPFGHPDVRDRIGVVGAWSPTSGDGLFATRVHYNDQGQPDRRVFGSNELAMRYAARARPGAFMTLVVIDSERLEPDEKWGGAGGVGKDSAAWVSICDFQPSWTQAALHELGHSFGLADEYEHPGPAGVRYRRDLPNVSDQADARQTRWGARDFGQLPTNPTLRHNLPNPHPAGTIGTFQGAFYDSNDYYRPSYDCKMREVSSPFCEVCASHIVKVLTP